VRFGAKAGGLPASVFNMSRTDAAGIAIFVCVAIFIVLLVKIASE
jgi:hypothetical protein